MPSDNSNNDSTSNESSDQEQAPPPKVPKERVSKDGDVDARPSDLDDGSEEGLAERWQIEEHSTLVKVLLVLVALLGVFIILSAWRLIPFNLGQEVTNNAYVHGRTTVISPQVAGYVVEILVDDFARVKSGQTLVKIDNRVYRNNVQKAIDQLRIREAELVNTDQKEAQAAAQIEAAKASIGGAQASLNRALAEWRRASVLVEDESISVREFEMSVATKERAEAGLVEAKARLRVAQENLETVRVGRKAQEAAVSAARTNVKNAKIDLGFSEVIAPRDGALSAIDVKLGQLVSAGTPLFYLVPEDIWVVANLKEVQTADLQLGQAVSMTVDALNDALVKGRVQSIAPAAGSEFSLSKPDRATGNFIKVPQRISVRVQLDPTQDILDRLRPGMSVEATFELEGDIPAYSKPAGAEL